MSTGVGEDGFPLADSGEWHVIRAGLPSNPVGKIDPGKYAGPPEGE